MDNNIARAIARIIDAASRCGLPASVARDAARIFDLTPAGQLEALARWERCMQTWPGRPTLQGAA